MAARVGDAGPGERGKVRVSVSPALVGACPSLDCLTPGGLEALADVARQTLFEPGDRLVPPGQPHERLLILTDGLAKMVGVPQHGQERILFLFQPFDMVGPSVLMDGTDSDHEVVAVVRTRALAVGRRDALIIARSHPSLLLALAREISRQLVAMTERIMDTTSAQVPVRLSKLLLDFSRENGDPGAYVPLRHALTHDTMAKIIGASRPHTSSTLRLLEECGAVLRQSRSGLLVRPSRLRMIVDEGTLGDPGFLRQDLSA